MFHFPIIYSCKICQLAEFCSVQSQFVEVPLSLQCQLKDLLNAGLSFENMLIMRIFQENTAIFQILLFLICSWKRMCMFYANVLSRMLQWRLPRPRPLPHCLIPHRWRKMASNWLHQPLQFLLLPFQKSRTRASRQGNSRRSVRKSVRRISSLLLLLPGSEELMTTTEPSQNSTKGKIEIPNCWVRWWTSIIWPHNL